jgi:ubiquitin C-terminal hydrolase
VYEGVITAIIDDSNDRQYDRCSQNHIFQMRSTIDHPSSALVENIPKPIDSLNASLKSGNPQDKLSRSIPNPKASLTLEQCLYEHTREENLDEANAWYCSTCQKHQCAKKLCRFWAPLLPEVLIVVLKRFEFRDVSALVGRSGTSHREKIDILIDFPMYGLDLTPYCCGITDNESEGHSMSNDVKKQKIDKNKNQLLDAELNPRMVSSDDDVESNYHTHQSYGYVYNQSKPIYDLFAVCNHYGRLGFGHYTSYARDWNGDKLSDDWYSFDDNDVTKVDPSEVISNAAYILFYRRRPRFD